MKSLAILGASGHGKVLADIAELVGWGTVHFFDDGWPEKQQIGPWDVVGNTQSLISESPSYQGVIVAIGNNAIRLAKQLILEQAGCHLINLVHPSAVVSKYAILESGSVIMANAVINPFSQLGRACIVNTSATVDHDCVLSDGVHISPGANLAGGVTIGQCSWVGVGAAVRQLITIGDDVIVGAGAAVVSNLSSNNKFVGMPAKLLSN